VVLDTARLREPARLVLVTSNELAWQRARYRQAKHLFTPADPVLVGLDTLQHWLWSRIGAPQLEPELAHA
jgi:hypothetical protein